MYRGTNYASQKSSRFIESLQPNVYDNALYKWFFIEYWIKTGLDFYPGPFCFYTIPKGSSPKVILFNSFIYK